MNKVVKLAMFACASTLAACSDAVAPHSQSNAAPPVLAGGVMTSLSMSDTLRFSITIDPSQNSAYYLGAGNSLTFPAGSVCDPALSTYGPTQWDNPCIAATSPVTVSVKAWLNGTGHPQVDFSPNLRFVPSTLPTGWVNIAFSDYAASLNPLFKILYCSSTTGTCIDESTTDPTLLTVSNPVTGTVTRRIKHFSGYLVGAGGDSTYVVDKIGPSMTMPGAVRRAPSNPSAEASAAAEGLTHESGYILASGYDR